MVDRAKESYGGPQLSHQKQIAHIKKKLLTPKTNCSKHQKQIAHIKFKLLTSNSNRTLNSTTDRSAVELDVQFSMAGNESEQELHTSGLFIPVEFVKKLLLDYNYCSFCGKGGACAKILFQSRIRIRCYHCVPV